MCEINFDDGEPVSVWREREVQARKPYRCDCCNRSIAAGEKYIRHFSVCDGGGFDEKMCVECKADRETFAKHHHGFVTSPNSFREYLIGCIDPHEEESVKLWSPMLEAMRERGLRDRST